tara:strand:- start:1393 stop:2133 length:741 start_codon:yes stop_codon:yes gene_type:complete
MTKKASRSLNRIERDKDGLIVQPKVDYVFNDDGFVDWRKMIKQEFLVPNRQKTNETDVSKLEDRDLIILLGGIKELAQIRGYTNVTYNVVSPTPDYVVATCSIDWIPNYETEGNKVTFSSVGDASPMNTSGFASVFLGPIAENRAFVRCVRNFLKVSIVGQDELGGNGTRVAPPQQHVSEQNSSSGEFNPKEVLESLMKQKKVSLEVVKKKLAEEGFDDASKFNSISDIPNIKAFELIERLKKIKN